MACKVSPVIYFTTPAATLTMAAFACDIAWVQYWFQQAHQIRKMIIWHCQNLPIVLKQFLHSSAHGLAGCNLGPPCLQQWLKCRCCCRFSALGQADSTMLMLRPCPKVAKHMQALLQTQPQLQFPNGAGYHDFLDWYFKRTRWVTHVRTSWTLLH